jgi:hypothetical protein
VPLLTVGRYAGSTSTALYFTTTRNNGEIVALDKSFSIFKTMLSGESEKTLKMARVVGPFIDHPRNGTSK